jgi:Skp family chaperone for outer membrane proteins
VLDSEEGRSVAENLRAKFTQAKQSLDEKQLPPQSLDYRRQMEDLQHELETERAHIMSDLGKKVLAVVDAYAQRKHYEAVLDISNPNTPVLWSKKSNDITAQIIAEYNKVNSRSGRKP